MSIELLAALLAAKACIAWIGWACFLKPAFAATNGPRQVPAAPLRPADLLPRLEKHGRRLAKPAWRIAAFLLAVAAAIATTIAVISTIPFRSVMHPLQASQFERQDHIHSVLREKVLPMPAPLPPSAFAELDRQSTDVVDRSWDRLDRLFAQKVLRVFGRMEARGYPMALVEGYRSPARQDALAQSGPHVTSARAFQSRHQFGLAADVAPVRSGRIVLSERDPWSMSAYQALGEEARREGLIWGGDWAMKDFGHIEEALSLTGSLPRIR